MRTLLLLLPLLLFLCLPAPARAAAPGVIETVAGGGAGDGGLPTAAMLDRPASIAFDAAGSMYIAELGCSIRKVTASTIVTVAGTGVCTYSGDGGPATAAALNRPTGVAVDGAGDLYIADAFNCRVRKVAGGVITTIAGTGTCGYSGDGGPPTAADLYHPWGLAFDGAGHLYIADSDNCRVRAVVGGTLDTVAGSGVCGYGGDAGPATAAALHRPAGITFGGGDLYIADSLNCRVRKVSAGNITTVAGSSCGYSGDGGPATAASLNYPIGIRLDAAGSLYIVEGFNCLVRQVIGGTISTLAGDSTCAYAGDGGAPGAAVFNHPADLAFDAEGNVYVADAYNCRVRKIAGAVIVTFAGAGCAYGGDGGPAVAAALNHPTGVALDMLGNLYIADSANCRVRGVVSTTIATVAGDGTCAFGGDGGPATGAALDGPSDVASDGDGALYIADQLNCRVRKVVAGTITTIAGTGTCAFTGDGGPATAAAFNRPSGIAVDGAGALYVADTENCRIRKVVSGMIATVAGNGTCSFGGDGGPATSAALNRPSGIAVDGGGDLYIADADNCRARRVSSGTITTVAGNGSCAFAGDGGAAIAAALNRPSGVAIDPHGNVYIADYANCRVRVVSAGKIATLAGTGVCTFAGDGGPATIASLDFPSGVAISTTGDLYIADSYSDRVRRLLVADTETDGVPDVSDNCPTASNPSQANTDNEIDNGPGIVSSDATVPNATADSDGDACETDGDADNDGLPDAQDTNPLTGAGLCGALTMSDGHPNPAGGDVTNDDNANGVPASADATDNGPSWDTDNDGVLDGVECQLGFNPRLATSKPNVAACGGNTDADNDGLPLSAERCKWGTLDTSADSDGDGKKDCVEANDTNGDGVQNFPGDTINSTKAAAGVIGKTMDFDLNGDGAINFPGDTILSAKMVNHVGGICM